MPMPPKRVCIIGAGAAGLAAVRHVKESQMTGIVFERTGDIGGIWNYTELTGIDKNGDLINSPAYKGLRTNLPKEIMGFLDYEMTNGNTSFIYHQEVLQYLRNYTEKFNLLDNIQFNTRVTCVKPVPYNFTNPAGSESKSPLWEVAIKRTNGTKETLLFDAIMICNGHFSKPQIPNIENLENFKGEIIHSIEYRIPEPFANKRVIVVGSGPSGIDIALEIAEVVSELSISMKNVPCSGNLPPKIHQVGLIRSIKEKHVLLENGDEILCDVLLLCSGYEYDLPFLTHDCGLTIERGKRINLLYKQMINIKYPSMALIGIPFRVCPFQLFDAQVRYFVSCLQGMIRLPSEAEMTLEVKEESQRREATGIPFSRSHQLEDLQWDYFQTLGKQAGFLELLQPCTRTIYDQVGKRRRDDPLNYKTDQICISEHRVQIVPLNK